MLIVWHWCLRCSPFCTRAYYTGCRATGSGCTLPPSTMCKLRPDILPTYMCIIMHGHLPMFLDRMPQPQSKIIPPESADVLAEAHVSACHVVLLLHYDIDWLCTTHLLTFSSAACLLRCCALFSFLFAGSKYQWTPTAHGGIHNHAMTGGYVVLATRHITSSLFQMQLFRNWQSV